MSSAESIARSLAHGAVGPERLPPEIVDLLTLALRRGATDILLAVDRAPSLRVSATLVPVEELTPPGPDAIARLAHTLLGERGIAGLEQHHDRDFAFEVTGLARFRGSFYYQRGGLALALRVLPASIPSLEELGLPSVVARLASLPRGLILVTGPTGSGKSTALAAIIGLINLTHAKHIVTIEDPVEFVHADKLIREGRAHHIYGAIQAGQQVGMRTMNHSLASLVKRRHVTLEDAEARSPDVKELRQLLAP